LGDNYEFSEIRAVVEFSTLEKKPQS
jgi:hypothetical protein